MIGKNAKKKIKEGGNFFITSGSRRVVLFLLLAVITAGALFFLPGKARAANGDSTICKWKDNKAAAYSMNIDDNPWGECQRIFPIVNPRGIKMTIYLIPSFVDNPNNASYYGTWDEWRTVPAMGHEIGSHSLTHPIGPPYDAADFSHLSASQLLTEVRDSKLRIEQEIPANGKCLTIAYPGCTNNSDVRTVSSQYYISGRSCSGFQNQASPALDPVPEPFGGPEDPTLCSMFRLCTLFTTPTSRNTTDIDDTIAHGGWSESLAHGLDEADVPSFTQFAEDRKSVV